MEFNGLGKCQETLEHKEYDDLHQVYTYVKALDLLAGDQVTIEAGHKGSTHTPAHLSLPQRWFGNGETVRTLVIPDFIPRFSRSKHGSAF